MQRLFCARDAFAAVLLCATTFTAFAEKAQPATQPQTTSAMRATRSFHIPPQPLAAALRQFAAQSGETLAYPPGLVAGKQSPGIDGDISSFEALVRLLIGTDLAFRQSQAGVTIFAAATTGPSGTGKASAGLAAAWQNYTAAVEDGRARMEATARFRDEPWTRAEAYHTLAEVEAMAYNFVISPRLDFPRIQEATGWQVNNYTLGQDGPDSLYGNLYLDGRQSYKITARPGQVDLTLLEVYSHVMGQPASKMIGNYDLSKMHADGDGTITVLLSPTQRDGNWIRLDPSSTDNWILIRRWMGDWNDDPGEMHIEMVSKPPAGFYDYDEFDEAAIAKRINAAADLIRYVIKTFNVGLFDMYTNGAGGEHNQMSLLPGTTTSQIGSPTSHYSLGTFDLKDDEALIVELDPVPKDAAYWSFQLGDPWSRALDFMNCQTSLNMREARIGTDGKFWGVISRIDPGIANWLDTTRHPDGTIVFRNYRSTIDAVPIVKKVKLADIWAYLPKDTVKVTPEQRAAAIAHRRDGIDKAYHGVF